MKKTQKEKESEHMEAAIMRGAEAPQKEEIEKFDFETFQFTSLADFDVYNSHVRRHNRLCLHERNKMKVKVPDESFHKKVKVKFHKMQQAENVQKVRVRNKDIDWEGQLKSGGTYLLPVPVVKFLNRLSTPIFQEVKTEHGNAVHSETKQVGEEPRFSCSVVEFD